MLTMYVEVGGSYSYDTQIGGSAVVPLLNVFIIEITGSGGLQSPGSVRPHTLGSGGLRATHDRNGRVDPQLRGENRAVDAGTIGGVAFVDFDAGCLALGEAPDCSRNNVSQQTMQLAALS